MEKEKEKILYEEPKVIKEGELEEVTGGFGGRLIDGYDGQWV
ncbi:hypothetical protein SAMN05444392_101782 [Seinonella peptonophila]|uniref:Uncharacterized protein n=1 Tax=Seinonella peptonophila TaxID=112248 RepID=A0A1M4U2Z9_9BACL|nr:hypothetical protein [Seinonella peptonophila]SHE51092.1 hypothetical protein SAMN05444392_101782 [Seinonella peptonophila]